MENYKTSAILIGINVIFSIPAVSNVQQNQLFHLIVTLDTFRASDEGFSGLHLVFHEMPLVEFLSFSRYQ